MGVENHPVAWYRDFDGGRSFYTALGHTESTYSNAHFLDLVAGGLAYAMGGDTALDYSRSRPEAWRMTRTILDSNLYEPVKIAFAPTGELYFIERRGALKRYDFAAGESVTVAEIPTFVEFESGMLGLAFDPDFATNHWLYLYRSTPRPDPTLAGETVLSRFQLVDNELNFDSEQVLLRIPSSNNDTSRAAHAGGDMQFDAQGNLWLTTGDDTAAGDFGRIDDRPGFEHMDAARSAGNTQDLRGKILRIKPGADGGYTIPPGNLFENPDEGRPEIYVMGVRNPFTLAVDSRTGYVYWGEVGPDGKDDTPRGPRGYDEVNRTNAPGNFGWPYVIADNLPYSYFDYTNETIGDRVDPAAPENRSANNTGARVLPPANPAWLFYPYGDSEHHFELGSGGRNALVAPIYYSDDYADSDVKFPAYYDGKVIIGEFMRNWLQVVNTSAGGEIESITPLIEAPFSAPLDMAYGPDGALYLVEYGTNWFTRNKDAYLSRIEYYAGDNPPPVAVARAEPDVGAAPLSTTLDASASYDRGAGSKTLTYRWERLENGRVVASLGDLERQPVTFDETGPQKIRLTVTDNEGAQSSTAVRVTPGNERPRVTITTPNNQSFFFEDASFAYSVSVEDAEDGSTDAGDLQGVTIKTFYVHGDEELETALARHSVDPLLAGRQLLAQGSDCHACHQFEGESTGPSFRAIAARYAQRDDAAAYLARVIVEGGSGQWGGTHAMPAHPALSSEQVSYAVAAIQAMALSDAPGSQSDLDGVLTFSAHEDDRRGGVFSQVGLEATLGPFYPGRYIVHASYTDRGGENAGPLQGVANHPLRYPKIAAGNADVIEGPLIVKPGDGVVMAVFSRRAETETAPHVMLKGIDLTGIRSIEVAAIAAAPMLRGGNLEVHLDALDAPPLASVAVPAPLIPDLDNAVSPVDVSSVEGVHDIYFSSGVAEGDTEGAAFALLTIEFLR
jgi:cytochrome c